MGNLFKIALRNLFRYKRRTLLTVSLITLGVVFVLVFISISGSFKNLIIGQITDSMLGHIQVHRRGYVASIDNLPLNLNPPPQAMRKLDSVLRDLPEIEAYSPRIKFGGMFSNFTETTNIRLNGVYPEQEFRTVPLLQGRITTGNKSLKRGEIWVPELLARGMNLKIGDPVVVVATNKDGSVNGKQFTVSGILESATGPGGRDGYITLQDALETLRMPEIEISEMAIRIKKFDNLAAVTQELEKRLAPQLTPQGQPIFEVHSWEQLSPFYNIARMIEVMTLFIKLMLIAVVLISIMNVMIMAVYERIREIGTIAAIGTPPRKILSLFVLEGFCLGVIGAIAGNLIGLGIILILNFVGLKFDFGMQKDLVLAATIAPRDLIVTSGIVILVAVVASLQPALKASRMEPIKALRHV
jgi:putative ABC transport system permease protein